MLTAAHAAHRVCVVGSGIVGVTTAYYLAREGFRVTVIDSEMAPGLGASYANGAQLSYDYVAPLASPGTLRKLPSLLFNRESALRFVPRASLAQWSWCLSFLRACRASISDAVTAQLLALGAYSRSLVSSLIEDEHLEFVHRRSGKLVFYRDPDDFRDAVGQLEMQKRLGSRQSALNPAECISLEPALESVANLIVGGIHTESEETGDCHRLVVELTRKLQQAYGVEFRFGVRATRLRKAGSRITAIETTLGELQADRIVVAAGVGSRSLLKTLGVVIPLYPLTGYSLTVPIETRHVPPRLSVTDAHHKIVYASLGDRLRIAGMIDVNGYGRCDQRRISLLLRQARETFPNGADFGRAESWCGQRPSTPSSRPIIGPTAYSNLWLNVGHGGLGFTLACASGKLVADCVAGKPVGMDIRPFTQSRL